MESGDLATCTTFGRAIHAGSAMPSLVAERHVGEEPFAVLLGDDLIDPRDPLLVPMIDVQRRYGGSVVALIEVDPAAVSMYGCAAIEPTDDEDVVTVTDLVEKPDRADAPSNLAIIGRYVLAPEVFRRCIAPSPVVAARSS